MALSDLFRKKTIEDVLATSTAESVHGGGLHKNLRVLDLTALGIAAIIGTGVLSRIGKAIYFGGPSVVWLYIFTAVACGFSALCYAQFASTVPISGSAYTYSYITFGELLAWLVGWNLLMEYAIGNIAVAISWSDYFTGLMEGFGWKISPNWTMDYLTASRMAADPANASATALEAWNTAPQIGGFRLIADIPALVMTLLITALVYVGIRESKITGNVMVAIKLAIVLAVVGVGAFYIQPENWSPFSPNGVGGVMKGMAAVFFAYIGFDALSTMAEECRDPRRDLPRSMFWSLLICTVLYIAVVLVLTGLTSYKNFAAENPITGALDVKGDPLAFAFAEKGMHLFSGVIAFSAVIAIASVFMVFQIGQPRIWMTMSRDGLLPERFGRIHPRFKTPSFATIVTGLVVAIPALFMNLTEVTDLSSIGTLFAFAMVCGGVLVMDANGDTAKARYKVPYLNSRYWMLGTVVLLGIGIFAKPEVFTPFVEADETGYWDKIPFFIFLAVFAGTGIWAAVRQLSFIPTIGLLLNLFMMSQLGWTNWTRFVVWIVVGLVIYFGYSYANSKLARKA